MADIRTNYTNAYETTLSSALAAGATTVNVTDTTGSPAIPFYVVIDPGNDGKREVVLVDGGKTATTFTLSAATSRGQDGTSDVAHDPSAKVAIVPVAAMFNDLQDRVDARAAALTNHEGAADPHAQYLTATEGNAAYAPAGAVGAEVYRSSAFSVANGSFVAIEFNAQRTDTDGFHSTSANPARLTVPAGLAGTYLIVAHLVFDMSATGIRSARLALNGAVTSNMADTRIPAHGSVDAQLVVSAVRSLVAGDYVSLYGYQTSGAALNASGDASGWATKLSIMKLGD